MGNQTSQDKSGRRKSKTYNGGLNSPDGCSIEVHGSAIEDVRPTVERPPFTKEQKELVTKTWQILHEDMAKVGIVMFIGLFETRPDAKELFVPFKHLSSEDMKHSAHLRAHAMRVMGTVEKCLARIDEPEKLDELLHALGRRHSVYNVKSEFVDLIGPQFVRAIEPSLQEHWTPEVEDAWLSLFKLASVIMQETMIS